MRNDLMRVQKQIKTLPPDQQTLYSLTFDAMSEGLKSPESYQSDEFLRKTSEAFLSVFQSDAWKKATGFFFIRTMALMASLGTSSVIPGSPVTLRFPVSATSGFYRVLRDRKIRGLTIDSTETQMQSGRRASFVLAKIDGFRSIYNGAI